MRDKWSDRQTTAVGAWVVFSIGEFVIFPNLFGMGVGFSGLPEAVKNTANPDFQLWWTAVKIGLPVWPAATGICAFVFFKPD